MALPLMRGAMAEFWQIQPDQKLWQGEGYIIEMTHFPNFLGYL
jgi:hypothetical protein